MKFPTWNQIRCKLGFHRYSKKMAIIRKVDRLTIGRQHCVLCDKRKFVRKVTPSHSGVPKS